MDLENVYQRLSAHRGKVQGEYDQLVTDLANKETELANVDQAITGCLKLLSSQEYIQNNVS